MLLNPEAWGKILQKQVWETEADNSALNSNYVKSVRMFLRKNIYERKTRSFSVVNFPPLEKSITY